jgi:hypothetical protein
MRPGHGVEYPPQSRTEVKERVELYLYSLSGPSWPVLGRTLLLPLRNISYGYTGIQNTLNTACNLIKPENLLPVNEVLMLLIDPKLLCDSVCVWGGGADVKALGYTKTRLT